MFILSLVYGERSHGYLRWSVVILTTFPNDHSPSIYALIVLKSLAISEGARHFSHVSERYRVRRLSGAELAPWLDALGQLRIKIFREYPYLYEGSLEYEREYLGVYQKSERSLIVLVENAAGEVIGATTCLPMSDEGGEFQTPFRHAGIDLATVFYFGESLLLPEWRGRGLGKLFFDLREEHARELGFPVTTFCAVDRLESHPLRPASYRPLDGFWRSRGYEKQPGLQATYEWKEIGESAESPKMLTFWTRTWNH